jgi:3-isopropylmalate/(R)-2-methylmalate dehydratase large subunit
MIDWIRERNDAPFECVYPDHDARYAAVRTVDLSALEPLVAFPDSVIENSQPVGMAAGTPIDQAFVGSCANGTLDDLRLVAQVLAGRRVNPKVRFIVTPASQTVYREAAREGILSTLLEAGAVVTSATCGACSGGHMGVLAAERDVHHGVDAQLQRPHGARERPHLHGLSGDRRGLGDRRRDRRSPAVPAISSR